jgi:hypothetical protein
MVTTSRQLEINSIAVHPSRPDMIFIGTNNYGVMVSNDGGKSFTPTNGGFSGRFANAILPDRETPNRIYASTINTATGGGFLFVSNDNGESWRPSMRSMPSRLITYSILQDARDANVIYSARISEFIAQLDRGTSWAPVWAIEKPKAPAKKAAPKENDSAWLPLLPKRNGSPTLDADETILRRRKRCWAPLVIISASLTVNLDQSTTAAVKKFQGDRHLPVTGKLDAITLAALGVGKGTGPAAPNAQS